MASRPPAPSGQALSLISALSNPGNHQLHVQAIRARDDVLSASIESYGSLCLQLSYALAGSDRPQEMLAQIDPSELEAWRQTDTSSVLRLQQDPSLWVAFGQTAGFILKNALQRPPVSETFAFHMQPPAADCLKETLLATLGCTHVELRAVASSIIAAVAVSHVQPLLSLAAWPSLVRYLVNHLQHIQTTDTNNEHLIEGCLSTLQKIMEDGPHELNQEELDNTLPILIRCLSSRNERHVIAALHSIIACIANNMMPSSLVLHMNDYLAALGNGSTSSNPTIRKLVCRSIVTLLELRTEYLRPQLSAICQFILQATAKHNLQQSQNGDDEAVALEACEFWYTFCNLDDEACTQDMLMTVQALLPQLIPVLLSNMVYSSEKQKELMFKNDMEWTMQRPQVQSSAMRPVFHKSRANHGSSNSRSIGGGGVDNDEDDDGINDDGDDFDEEDDDGDEWTLRKCAAASLDCLASLFGADPILPTLLPALASGFGSSDPWTQEASMLALGAVAEGCMLELSANLGQLYPYLLNHLAKPEAPNDVPQLKVMAAWTIGRYAAWAVEQVQTGAQGKLLGQMTEVFMNRLHDRHSRVQIACCSGFQAIVEIAGDLMAPYLEPVYHNLVSVLSKYQGRSLLIVFDVFGVLADSCGSAIAEEGLPQIYVPSLLQLWDGLAKNDPTDRTLLPLMESLASIAMSSGVNFQPYALESFEYAMGIIEAVTLVLASSGETIKNEEDVDPIACAIDLLDGLIEGLGESFVALVSNSQRYGQHFLSAIHSLCKHEIPSVRMSVLALVGDLARNAPSLLEPALSEILKEVITGMDATHPAVCSNAVWAVGEICVRCEGNDALLRPFADSLMQNLIMLLMGNGVGGASERGTAVPGLAENAAACVGRLAKVNPDFVAPELHRFLLGWCDGMAKIVDPVERRDAFQGFIKTVYANPQAIQQAGDLPIVFASILFAILTFHMPPDLGSQSVALLNGEYNFRPFPQQEAELGAALVQLVQDMKKSAGEETWYAVEKELPVNVRRLLRESYYV